MPVLKKNATLYVSRTVALKERSVFRDSLPRISLRFIRATTAIKKAPQRPFYLSE
jgi:hypothetical protein